MYLVQGLAIGIDENLRRHPKRTQLGNHSAGEIELAVKQARS